MFKNSQGMLEWIPPQTHIPMLQSKHNGGNWVLMESVGEFPGDSSMEWGIGGGNISKKEKTYKKK